MQNYTTIIGIIELRLQKIGYETTQKRYGVGSSTVTLVMKRFRELGDIAMTRGEYAKLKAYITAHPELELNVIDINNQKDTIYACGKICDARTIVKESNFRPVEGYGAFIDVFLLDNIPNDEKERKRFKALRFCVVM